MKTVARAAKFANLNVSREFGITICSLLFEFVMMAATAEQFKISSCLHVCLHFTASGYSGLVGIMSSSTAMGGKDVRVGQLEYNKLNAG